MTPSPRCSGGFLDSEGTTFPGMLKPLLICFRTGFFFINTPGQSLFFRFPELLHLRGPGGTCDYSEGSKTKQRVTGKAAHGTIKIGVSFQPRLTTN